MIKRKPRPNFYSPCKCGNFKGRTSWVAQEVFDFPLIPERCKPIIVVVCKNCGRHAPN